MIIIIIIPYGSVSLLYYGTHVFIDIHKTAQLSIPKYGVYGIYHCSAPANVLNYSKIPPFTCTLYFTVWGTSLHMHYITAGCQHTQRITVGYDYTQYITVGSQYIQYITFGSRYTQYITVGSQHTQCITVGFQHTQYIIVGSRIHCTSLYKVSTSHHSQCITI